MSSTPGLLAAETTTTEGSASNTSSKPALASRRISFQDDLPSSPRSDTYLLPASGEVVDSRDGNISMTRRSSTREEPLSPTSLPVRVDETTAIFSAVRPGTGVEGYGTTTARDTVDSKAVSKRQTTRTGTATNPVGPASDDDEAPSAWKSLVDKYGSIELENKGSVARDHLAIERTFLAWLRTSLSFASIGIAITQLFRLNTSFGSNASNDSPKDPDVNHLRQVGKPLGATFMAIAILILFLGFHRYFESQHYVIQGKFPASRGSVVIVSIVACALIVTSLVIIIVVAPHILSD